MTDLHTHILCGMDDGARDPETSYRMLAMEREQGVNTVVLTPHFYRNRESVSQFLRRRKEAWERLQIGLTDAMPRTVLGAEVTWVPNLADCAGLDQLCLGDSGYMLLELPRGKWDTAMPHQIRSLMSRTGITPVLAHLERYWNNQRAELLDEVLALELPVQVTSGALLHLMSRGRTMKLLRDFGHIVASDCHDLVHRKPDLGQAMELVGKKLGTSAAAALNRNAAAMTGCPETEETNQWQ